MSQLPRSTLSRRKTSSILPLPELLLVCVAANGSIASCLIRYPTENPKISGSPPSLSVTPGAVNHTGAIVGGKQIFGVCVTRPHVLRFPHRCCRGNSHHRVVGCVHCALFASKEPSEPEKGGIGEKAASGGGIPLVARSSLSTYNHSGEFYIEPISGIPSR